VLNNLKFVYSIFTEIKLLTDIYSPQSHLILFPNQIFPLTSSEIRLKLSSNLLLSQSSDKYSFLVIFGIWLWFSQWKYLLNFSFEFVNNSVKVELSPLLTFKLIFLVVLIWIFYVLLKWQLRQPRATSATWATATTTSGNVWGICESNEARKHLLNT